VIEACGYSHTRRKEGASSGQVDGEPRIIIRKKEEKKKKVKVLLSTSISVARRHEQKMLTLCQNRKERNKTKKKSE